MTIDFTRSLYTRGNTLGYLPVWERVNTDLTPKEWSKPINRIDKAAYHHDICYLKNDDTETRNRVCDKNMLEEMKNIYNPTLRERMERGLVSTLIGTKKRFGWGVVNGTGYIKKKSSRR